VVEEEVVLMVVVVVVVVAAAVTLADRTRVCDNTYDAYIARMHTHLHLRRTQETRDYARAHTHPYPDVHARTHSPSSE
jgi:hypothetical protein